MNNEISIYPMSVKDGEIIGFPTSEPEEGVLWRKILIKGSVLYFEESEKMIWVIMVETEKPYRKQGRASKLVSFLIKYASNNNKRIEWGEFTDDGNKYIKHLLAAAFNL